MIAEKKAILFIDTGSTVTLMNDNFAHINQLTHLMVPSLHSVKSLSNHSLPIIGSITIPCLIAGHSSSHTFHVCKNLPYDAIIGNDTLVHKRVNIDMATKSVVTHYGSTPFVFPAKPLDTKNNVRNMKPVIIEPHKVHFITAQVRPLDKQANSHITYGNYEALFEPSPTFTGMRSSTIVIGRSINHTNNGLIRIQAINVSDEPIVLPRNVNLGKLVPLPNSSSSQDHDSSFAAMISTDTSHDEAMKQSSHDNTSLYAQLGIPGNNNLNTTQEKQLKNVIDKHASVFSQSACDVGKLTIPDIDTSIRLTSNVPKYIPERKIGHHQVPVMENLIQEMKDSDIIEECSYSDWNSPIMLVPKKNSTLENPKYRAVVDLRYLNSCTLADSYPVPSISNIFHGTEGSKYFSTFDITSGYHNIRLDPESRHLTAFSFQNKQYQHKVLPQGGKNSGSKFCRIISRLLERIPYDQIFAYIDDILICSKNFEDHMQKMDYILGLLNSHNLKVNPGKATIYQTKVTFVGYDITAEGVQISESKLDAVRKLTPPTDYKTTQQFCGFINYLRNHCPNLAVDLKPIYELLNKDRKWEWQAEHQKAYDTVISNLLKNIMLYHPKFNDNPDEPFIVSVDASSKGFGGQLEQVQDGKRVLISLFSKTMPKRKRELGSTRQEFLGIYEIIKYFRCYLLGKKFLAETDCEPLLGWEKTLFKKGTSVQMRQMNYLSEFHFDVVHIAGIKNVVPDYFSRNCLGGVSVSTQTEDVQPLCQQQSDLTNSQAFATLPNNTSDYVTFEDIKREQRTDATLIQLRSWVDNGPPETIQAIEVPSDLLSYYKQIGKFTIAHDVIMKKWDNDDGSVVQLMVVPTSLIEQVINQHHNTLEHPHFGINVTVQKIQSRFYFHDMKQEVTLYIKACITCAQVKQPKSYNKPLLEPINIYTEFNQGIIIDHIGPILPATPRGNAHILTCVDFFTGYMIAIPCKGTTGKETMEILLHHWMYKFGLSKNIHHDLGRGFVGYLFQAFMRSFNITSRKGQPYSPTTQGKVESFNKKIRTLMTAILDPSKYSSWDLHLPIVSFVLNNTKQVKTGFSAHELLFGKTMNQPSDLISQLPLPHYTYHSNVDENKSIIAYKQRSLIREVTNRARVTIARINNNTKRAHDKLSNNPEPYSIGDHCMIMKHVTGHKYERKWSGPYVVTKCIKPYLYKIRVDNEDKVVNIKIMKKYEINKYSTPLPLNPSSPSHTLVIPTSTSRATEDEEVPSTPDVHQFPEEQEPPFGLIAPENPLINDDVVDTVQTNEPVQNLMDEAVDELILIEQPDPELENHELQPEKVDVESNDEGGTPIDPLEDIPWPNTDYTERVPSIDEHDLISDNEEIADILPPNFDERTAIIRPPVTDVPELDNEVPENNEILENNETLENNEVPENSGEESETDPLPEDDLESVSNLGSIDEVDETMTELEQLQGIEESTTPVDMRFQEIPRRTTTRVRKAPVWANDYTSGTEFDSN